MHSNEIGFKIGDRVIISRPGSEGPFAERVERLSSVTAVRPKSFDAGGLCFRPDGREWSGHNRIKLIQRLEEAEEARARVEAREADLLDRAERSREDVLLAFVLSRRHQEEWLKLGLDELRRIAALHGIACPKTEALKAPQRQQTAFASDPPFPF
jgi:hypothetical protein